MSAKPDRRMEILQAALQAFAEKGYEGTSVDEIVKRSGLSKGTLYWYFKNKHDLLLATIDMVMKETLQAMHAATTLPIPASEKLAYLFRDSIKAFVDDDSLLGLITNFFFQSTQSTETQQIMREAYAVYIGMVEGIIQEGIDAGEFRSVDARTTAIMLMGAGDGIAFQSLLKPDWDITQVLDTLLELVIHGLKRDHPND